MTRKTRAVLAIAVTGLAALVWAGFTSRVESQQSARPQYTSQGELKLPVRLRKLGVRRFESRNRVYRRDPPPMADARTEEREAKRADNQLFHNVYISPEAYAHFAATKEFPDPTVLVMEVFTAGDKQQQPVLSTGVFNDKRVGLEVAVKDTRRPSGATSSTASGGVAVLRLFGPGSTRNSTLETAVKPDPSGFCQACHARHASKDNVWKQFYPTLRKLDPLAQGPPRLR